MTRSNTFEQLGVIGRGLTGTVYKARMRDGTLVALKVLDADKQRDRMVFGYFTNEKVVLKRIRDHRRHPHIVEYVADNFVKPPFWLATRLVDGVSLSTILNAQTLAFTIGKPQHPSLVVRVITDIADALDYLHTGVPEYSPIVHRDVKPDNILVGKDGRAVLIDFSIATHPHYGLTDEKVMGTLGYMAPEQLIGQEQPASDQFALAMVALQMLTGRRVRPSGATAWRKQIEEWQSTNYADIRQWLGKRTHTANIVCKALSVDPQQRFPSCKQFADSLRTALEQDGEKVFEKIRLKLPESSSTPAQLPARSSWIAVSLIVAMAILLLAFAIVYRPNPPSPTPASNIPTSTLVPSNQSAGSVVTSIAPISAPTSTIAPSQPVSTLAPTLPQSTLVPSGMGFVRMRQREPLRAGPSTETRILLWIPEGARAERTGREQQQGSFTWYEIRYNDQVGWCRSIFCIPN
jgi:serine/threonine protein kinase